MDLLEGFGLYDGLAGIPAQLHGLVDVGDGGVEVEPELFAQCGAGRDQGPLLAVEDDLDASGEGLSALLLHDLSRDQEGRESAQKQGQDRGAA